MNKYTVAYVVRNNSRHFLSAGQGWTNLSESRVFDNFYEASAVSERYRGAHVRPILVRPSKKR